MLIGSKRAEPRFIQIPDLIFEKLLEKFPKGQLPQVEHCYYLVITPTFGKPYAVPDFVVNLNFPLDWKSSSRKDCKAIAGHGLAPVRGSRIKQWFQDNFIAQIESRVGYVAWLPNPDTDKPWFFKPGSTLIRNGGMPDFKFGPSLEEALKEFT